MALPEAATKLRIVLDYLPCEACLAQPTEGQDLLCTVCARLHRQVGVRASVRTSVILERPSPPSEAPVVIEPASVPRESELPPPAPEPVAPPAPTIAVRFADEPEPAVGVVDVVVEPLPGPAPVVAPPLAAVVVPPQVEGAPVEAEEEAGFDDLFDYRKAPAAPKPEPAPAPVEAEPAPPQDDFVFRPPAEEPAPAPEEVEEAPPTEEIPVQPEESLWAPPSDFLADEEPQPEPEQEPIETEVEADVVEMEIVEDEPQPEPEPIEAEIVPDEPEEEVLDMEVVDEAPAASGSDLYRLRGFDAAAEGAMARAGVTQIAHLAGHDAGELSGRAGLPFERVLSWIQVADLVHDVGVPVDAALALVHAGVAGPRGLRDADAAELVDRVNAFGSGYQVSEREVKRWKRRA